MQNRISISAVTIVSDPDFRYAWLRGDRCGKNECEKKQTHRLIAFERRQIMSAVNFESNLKSSLRISAFLCVSAVTVSGNLFTAETQRNAKILKAKLFGWLCRGGPLWPPVLRLVKTLITSYFSRPPQRTSGFCAGVLSVLEHVLAVHKNVSNADRIL